MQKKHFNYYFNLFINRNLLFLQQKYKKSLL